MGINDELGESTTLDQLGRNLINAWRDNTLDFMVVSATMNKTLAGKPAFTL